jgi:hypothetical protein
MQLDVNVDEKPFRTLNKAIAEFIGVALFVFVGKFTQQKV